MNSITCFAPALAIAGSLLLHSGTLRAEDDPLPVNEGSRVPALTPETPTAPVCEIEPICIGVVKSPAGWQVSAALLFLQPSSSNLNYATVVNPFPFLTPHWSDQAVNPGFNPAFNVGLRYNFGGGGDVRLDWTHLNSNDSGSAFSQNPYLAGASTGPASTQALGPPFLIGPPLPFASAFGVAHFNYDAINLEAGLALNAGGHVQLRPFAGLQGARISQNLSGNFLSVDNTMGFIDVSKSVFTGVGPRLGMEMHYLAGRLDFLGGIAGSAIIGSRQSQIDFFTASPANGAIGLAPNIQSMTSPSLTQVIPCLDVKLGASYALPVGQTGVFRCEAGYQAAVYFNAINQYSFTEVENSLTNPTVGVGSTYLQNVAELQSNFMVHGPYVRFSFLF